MLRDAVILPHDNARPRTLAKLKNFCKTSGEMSGSSPCSQDLAPSDYFLFSKLKEQLSGTRLSSDSDVKTAAKNWLNGQRRVFYQTG
ncbi:hypothetical protein AVEN_213245-1 [Araneus ventricosus]|uniref:Uncharacterized protein n=1 Tax=Araneus ventricosus TaxID=182803 RepID=A0A4Y2WKM6_ARAVE|nr:hypothetical protein AVEN_213245-1 [Araneus ventricosus]